MAQITEVAGSPSAVSPSSDAQTAPGSHAPRGSVPSGSSGTNWRKWRARVVVLLMIAVAVFAATRLTEARRTSAAQFAFGTSILTAQAIPVESSQAGKVAAVRIVAGQKVTSGEVVGTMVTTTMTATGKPRLQLVSLVAPATGVISSDPTPIGGIVQPGQPLAEMYDPGKLTLVATVPVKDLSRVSAGMSATLRAEGLTQPVHAVVERIVPLVASHTENGQIVASQSRMQIVLTPQRPSDVVNLVPGIHFTGTVDTTTGPASAPDGLHVSG